MRALAFSRSASQRLRPCPNVLRGGPTTKTSAPDPGRSSRSAFRPALAFSLSLVFRDEGSLTGLKFSEACLSGMRSSMTASVSGMPRHQITSPAIAMLAETKCSSDQQMTEGLGSRRFTMTSSSGTGMHQIICRKMDNSPGHKETRLTQTTGRLWLKSSPKRGVAEKSPKSRVSTTCKSKTSQVGRRIWLRLGYNECRFQRGTVSTWLKSCSDAAICMSHMSHGLGAFKSAPPQKPSSGRRSIHHDLLRHNMSEERTQGRYL